MPIKRIISLALQNSLIRNSLILFAGTMIINVLNYVFHVLVGRSVDAHVYGEIESIISLLVIISVPATAITLVATKYAAGMRAEQNLISTKSLTSYITRKVLVYGLSFFILATILTPAVKNFLNIDSSLPILFLWSVMLLSFLGAVTSGILIGWQKFANVNVIGITSTILKLCAALLFIRWGFGVSGVVGSYALAALLGYLVSLYFLRRMLPRDSFLSSERPTLDFSSIKGYVLPAFYGALAIAILGNVDMVFARHHLSPDLSGEYGALTIMSKTIFFITGVLTTVLFTLSAEESHKQNDATNTFRLATFLTFLISACAVILFFAFPDFIIRFFFGEKYSNVSPLLGWFALAAGVYSFVNLFLQYLLSLHQTRVAAYFLALSSLEILILFLAGESIYAIISITIAIQVLAVILGLFFIRKKRIHGQADFTGYPSVQ